MPLSTGQVLNNRYRIVRLLGQGGFGAVYRAWDINLEGPVALKESFETSPAAQKQFQTEAKLLFRLVHPNLPRVHDCFVIPDQGIYLTMDFIEGEDLETLLARSGGPLPEAQVVDWVKQVCSALAYLHQQDPPIIHRDIKPANIRITPEGKAMLVDFGIAKLYDPHLATTVGAKAVTPGFSPPEQYGGGATDPRSDIYALGATLYTLLTGQRMPESITRITTGAPLTPPHVLNSAITPAVEHAILRSTEVTTDRRFQTVQELQAALSRGPDLVVAPAPSSVVASPVVAVPPTRVAPTPEYLPPAPRIAPPPAKRSSLPYLLGGAALFALLAVCLLGGYWMLAGGLLSGGTPTLTPVAMLSATDPVATTPTFTSLPPTQLPPTSAPSPTAVRPLSPTKAPPATWVPTQGASAAWQVGVDFYGGDWKAMDLAKTDPVLCEQACNEDAVCKAWTYVEPGEFGPQARCFLKYTLLPASPKASCISGVKANLMELESGVDRLGWDWNGLDLQADDPRLCQKACLADPLCKAWTYVKPGIHAAGARCYTKFGVPPASYNDCCVSGIHPDLLQFEWNVNRPGGDYKDFELQTDDPSACQSACLADSQCQAWTYVKPNTLFGSAPTCWLKGAVPAPVIDQACCVSGISGR